MSAPGDQWKPQCSCGARGDLADANARLAEIEALCVEAETPPLHSMIPLGCVRVSEVRAALHQGDPT